MNKRRHIAAKIPAIAARETVRNKGSKIHNGLLKPGQRLPSIRKQSQKYECSLNTIISVYQELEKEFLIYSRPKSGYFVVAQEVLLPLIEKKRIDFAAASPDPTSVPQMDLRQCLNKAMELFEVSIVTFNYLQKS